MFVSLDSGGVKFIYHARHEKQRKANMIAKLRQHKCQECYQAVVQRGAIFKNKFAEKFSLPKKICKLWRKWICLAKREIEFSLFHCFMLSQYLNENVTVNKHNNVCEKRSSNSYNDNYRFGVSMLVITCLFVFGIAMQNQHIKNRSLNF